MIEKKHITGLVLAGGRGSRMGGVDKGLQLHEGVPLALRALRRLAPQVGPTMLNANRHLDAYAEIGAAGGTPVWPDALPDYPGPLAGFLAGLAHCTTPWLVTVPCDSPHFPPDLVARLVAGLEAESADVALAATREDGALRAQPVFCLMRATLRDSLAAFTGSGRRKIDAWTASLAMALVPFDDVDAFANANTLDELSRLQRHD
jgi:molybdopterin-guanine dinucleotide biosynthesis protein A